MALATGVLVRPICQVCCELLTVVTTWEPSTATYRVWIDGSLAAFASGRHAVGVGDGSFDIEAAAPVSVGSAPDADGDGFEGVATALKVWRVVLSPLQASTPSLYHPRPLVSKPRSLSRGEPLAPLALAL